MAATANLTSTAAAQVQNTGSSLLLDLSNAGSGSFTTNMTASTFAWAIVNGFHRDGLRHDQRVSKQLVRDGHRPGQLIQFQHSDFTTDPSVDTGAGQYSGGTLTLLSGPRPTNSLFINANAPGVLDLGNTGAAP